MIIRNQHQPLKSALEALLRPNVIRLGKNLYGVDFDTMKVIPAFYTAQRALEMGELKEGAPIIETTSGTMGRGDAYAGRALGIPVKLVSDPVLATPLKNELESLGCEVHIVQTTADNGDVQALRLARIYELLEQHPGAYWGRQYDNPLNADSYGAVAEQLVDEVGDVHCLVATVGSGGSSGGTAKYLRKLNPKLRLIGVDTHGSVIFGQPKCSRPFRGLGNSLVPKNVRHDAFDEVHWLGAPEGYAATRILHRRQGMFKGPTSGAAFWVAQWYAAAHPDQVVVALLPDSGHRYADTVYNDQWLACQGLTCKAMPIAPDTVFSPSERMVGWTRIDWKRRTLAEVLPLTSASETMK